MKAGKKDLIMQKMPPVEDSASEAVTVAFVDDSCFSAVFTGSATHLGTRDYQEDSLFVTEGGSSADGAGIRAFGIVCDGMGGLENGDKASRIAVDLMREAFEGVDSEAGIEARLVREMHAIDAAVRSGCAKAGAAGAGTTLVGALVFGKRLHWVGVGDSRIYVLRGGEIVQVTQDHTHMTTLLKLVENGELTLEEAEAHPQKGALISYIGSGDVKHINSNKAGLDLVHGDVVLLCSDGLVKSLTDARIAEIIEEYYGNMGEAAKQLVLRSFDSSDGSKDNTSVVLMQYFE